MNIRSICVYCGSQPGRNPLYREAAARLGSDMARHGIRLVYGGGTKGIMGEVARAVREGGGAITGIIPEFLLDKERGGAVSGETGEVIITRDMHERKHLMFERSDAFVALPGGIGTLEEIVEIMTWGQLGRHRKPIAFANVGGFWDPMLTLIGHMDEAGFIHTRANVQPLVIDRAENIVQEILKAGASVPSGDAGEEVVIARL